MLWTVWPNYTSKEGHEQRTSLCFSAASGTLHEDLHTLHFSQWHKLSIEALLCNSQCFCIVNSDLYLSNTQKRVYCYVALVQWLCQCTTVFHYTYVAYLVIHWCRWNHPQIQKNAQHEKGELNIQEDKLSCSEAHKKCKNPRRNSNDVLWHTIWKSSSTSTWTCA